MHALSFPARIARIASDPEGREPRGLGSVPSPLGSLPSQRYALLAGNDIEA